MADTQTPHVSIGLPVYNGENYLSQAIEALLGQTFRDFELIISDNASSDRTAEICRHYAASDSRVSYHRNDANRGPGWNYRRVFALARGPYFRWATYDDLNDPTCVARCVEILDRNPEVVLAYPKTRLIDGDGKLISEFEDRLHLPFDRALDRLMTFSRNILLCNAIYGLIRSASLRRTRLMEDFIGSDISLLAELTLHGKFFEVPEVLFSRRIHSGAYSSLKTTEEMLSWYEPTRVSHVDWTEWRQLRHSVVAVGRAPLRMGERVSLWKYLARTVVWRRRELLSEALTAVRQYTRRG